MQDKILNIFLVFFCILSIINKAQFATIIEVTTVEELHKALSKAKAGQIISIAPGIYDFTTYERASKFYGTADGTEYSPITLTASDPNSPPILKGSTLKDNYVLHITGDYWIIENLKIAYSQKGIVLDNSNYSILRNLEVYSTGAEAIAIRDGSSHCLVQNCYIHNTGLVTPAYGEGIYIGSSESTTGYDYKCDNNIVQGCVFRDVSAEHIDIKEYTTGQEVFGCTFYGDGMSGENYAGSFIDIAGNDCYIHDNVGYRNKNKKIVAAFEVHRIVENWGDGHIFANNVLYMDRPYGEENTNRRMYVVDGWDLKFSVKNNKVDYGSRLIDANSWEFYNSDFVTYLE
jgi:hypothetical protein